jgi:DNA-binding NarL/FixJ family response regulator
MRHPQLLVYEHDGRLATLLAETAWSQKWVLRKLRQPEACPRQLRHGNPSVLVLSVGRFLERELTLLERITRLFPDTGVVVQSDSDNPALTALLWDLGASYVLQSWPSTEQLLDLVTGLMTAAIHRIPKADSR